jgi:transposase
MWMRRGEQAVVETPGNNRKCHLAGSLVWGTGTLLVSQPEASRNTELFLSHLDDLRRRLRSWKRIHVICDNAPFHKSRAVQQCLARWEHRIRLHYLPKYAPETNPIERVWWHLHETLTRNHRCRTLEELVRQAYDWFAVSKAYFMEMRRTFAKAAA